MRRLKYGMLIAEVAGRRHPHAPHQSGNEIRQDVAEHIFGDYHIEPIGPLDQVKRGSVDVDRDPSACRDTAAAISSKTRRKNAIEGSTFALSTSVTCFRRLWACSKARCGTDVRYACARNSHHVADFVRSGTTF